MKLEHRSPEAIAWRKLYKSRAWTNGRLIFLASNPLCERCLNAGRTTAATVVNHRTPHKGDVVLFFDQDNWEATCKPCHDRDIATEERRGYSDRIGIDGWPVDDRHPVNNPAARKRHGWSIPDGVQPSGIPVMLVCGPPAAGKSTYVQMRAAEGDTIIDFDAIRRIVGGTKWDQRKAINRKAFAYRDKMIRGLADRRKGKAWLIAMAPTKAERTAWANALGRVTEVMVVPSKEQCLKQMRSDPDRKATEAIQQAEIERWFAAYDGPSHAIAS